MRLHVVHHPGVLRRRLGMTAPKAHRRAERFGQKDRLTFVSILVVQHQKNAIVPPVFQALCRHARPHLAQENRRLALALVQAANGPFHVQEAVQAQLLLQPDHPAGGRVAQEDLPQSRVLRLPEPCQAIVNPPLDAQQLPALFRHGLLLSEQLFLDLLHIPVFQEIPDLRKRHVQRPQIADGVEHLKLAHAVIAVAGVRVDFFGNEQPLVLVVPQAAHAQVEQPGHVADAKQLIHAPPPVA